MIIGLWLIASGATAQIDYTDPLPFGDQTKWAKSSDNSAVGEWWNAVFTNAWQRYEKLAVKWFNSIDRAEAMAFALYTHDHGVLKITGQCFPLLPDEPKVVTGGQVLTVELTGTEQVKTATFFLRQVEFSSHTVDYDLIFEGLESEPTISFVRVIRLEME